MKQTTVEAGVRLDHVDRSLAALERERPDVDFSAWGITKRITRLSHFVAYEERCYEAFGLNRGGVEVMLALLRAGPPYRLSPTEMCRDLLSASGTMTSRLDKLEQDGLIERTPDASDRRGVSVALTPKGRELIDRVIDKILEVRMNQVTALSPQESKTLTNLLRKLLLSFEG